MRIVSFELPNTTTTSTLSPPSKEARAPVPVPITHPIFRTTKFIPSRPPKFNTIDRHHISDSSIYSEKERTKSIALFEIGQKIGKFGNFWFPNFPKSAAGAKIRGIFKECSDCSKKSTIGRDPENPISLPRRYPRDQRYPRDSKELLLKERKFTLSKRAR